MKILVSACLLGENCKYSGGNNYCAELMPLLEGHEIIPVCPEVLGGLPTPRLPSEIAGGVVTARDGRSVDAEFHSGAQRAFELALKNQVDCAILQARSPSCGVHQVYDGSFSGRKIPGQGVFAALLKANDIPAEDTGDMEAVGRMLGGTGQ